MVPMTNLDVGAFPKTYALRDARQAQLRPLDPSDKLWLLRFFEQIPEDERYYLKENVTSPEVILAWTSNIDYERVIPIVAVVGGEIVADATLHRSRSPARQSRGEIRVVVRPDYRDAGLGSRLMRELVEIGLNLRLHTLTMELIDHREKIAIATAKELGFSEVARLREWSRDIWGNYEDVILLELRLTNFNAWWRFQP
jgi:RimJ/RimL family protein N-acetyltransferase